MILLSLQYKDEIKLNKIKTKKIKQLDKNNNIVNIFNSIKEAAENVKVHPSNISNVCNNKRKISKGFYWEFFWEFC